MDILFAPLYLLLAHQFLGGAVLLVLGAYAVRFLSNRQGIFRETARSYGFVILLAAFLLKVFFGHGLAVRLVHVLGKDARGLVVDSYGTGTVYNNQRVEGYHVLLALADGRTVQESFRTDSFNVYPPHNATTYPAAGQHFDARYLPHFPSAFIILSDGDGGFAQDLRCDKLGRALHAAELKHQFAPENGAFRLEAITALQRYMQERCELTPEAVDDDTGELRDLQQSSHGH